MDEMSTAMQAGTWGRKQVAQKLLVGPHGVRNVRPNTAEVGSRAVPTDSTGLV